MIIGEVTGLFLIPFGANTGATVWDLLNETKLFFIPFLIALISETFDARAQGADEGSAAVLALKRVELKAMAMFACLLLFVMPAPGSPTFNFKQYSCTAQPSLIGGPTNVLELAPTNGVSGGGVVYAQRNVSILSGLINDFGITLSNVLTGTLPCKQGSSVNDINKMLSVIRPRNESHRESLAAFAEQCYTQAVTRHDRAAADGTILFDNLDYSRVEDQKGYSLFMSSDYMKLYNGTYVSPEKSSLMMSTGKYWFDTAERNKEIYCHDAAEALHDRNKIVIRQALELRRQRTNGSTYKSDYDGSKDYDLKAIVEYFRQYDRTVSMPLIEKDLSHYLMVSAYNSKLQGVDGPTLKDETLTGNTAWHLAAIKDLSSSATVDRDYGAGSEIINVGVYVGSWLTTFKEGVKAYTGIVYVPLVSTLIQCLILAVYPLVVVLSGYNFKIAWGLLVMYFGLTMVPFWLNVGLYMASLVSSYTSMASTSTYIMQQEVVGYIFVYTSPILWMAFIQSLGGVAAGAFGGIATSAGDSAVSGATALLKGGMKATKGSGKGGKKKDRDDGGDSNAKDGGDEVSAAPDV